VFRSPKLLRACSDEELVDGLRAGSDTAFEVMSERYRERLTAYVRRMVGGEAEDVVQDVFARAYAALPRDDRPVTLRPWLYRVAHNRCMDVLRRPLPLPSELMELERSDGLALADHAQRRQDLRDLVADIKGLPDQQRSALIIRELEGLSYEELSDALDTTVPAVKSLLVRARMNLAKARELREAVPAGTAPAEHAALRAGPLTA